VNFPLRFYLARGLGRAVTHSAALLTGGNMPPFVSASVIVVRDARVLCVLDPLRREPVFPGGHLKWQEAPADGACREAREETGLDVVTEGLVGVYAGPDRVGDPGIIRVVYTGRLVAGTLTSSREGEAGWMDVAEFIARSSRDGPILETALALAPRHPTA
jgi:ADP-ribose pyrophosphatase YjhB (NUDIX family)